MKVCWITKKKTKVEEDFNVISQKWLNKHGHKHEAAWLKARKWHFTFIAFPRIIKLEDTDKKCFVWLRFVRRKLADWSCGDSTTNLYFFARHPIGRTWIYKL